MKKTLVSLATATVLGLAANSASATPINVGGVVWDPDATNGYPNLSDFYSTGTVFESYATAIGQAVTGFGKIQSINSSDPSASASFCPSCELTYTFSMTLASAVFGLGNSGNFTFSDLVINVMVDTAKNYNATYANANDGTTWLTLKSVGLLSGVGSNIGTGSDTGTGQAVLDVIGGLAMSNFDTNSMINGADATFSSSFSGNSTVPGLLQGTVNLSGNSIPEPGTLALAGLGLLGVSTLRRRKN